MSKLRKKRGFTTIANSTCQQKDLSLQAKGFLALLLSLPDDWHFNFDALVKMSNNGAHSTRTAMNELTSNGYLSKCPIRTEGGKFSGWDWIISDEPQTLEQVEKPEVQDTVMTVFSSTDKHDDITKKNSTKKNNKEEGFSEALKIFQGVNYTHSTRCIETLETKYKTSAQDALELWGEQGIRNAFIEASTKVDSASRIGYKWADILAFAEASSTKPLNTLNSNQRKQPAPNQIWLHETSKLFLVENVEGNTVHGIIKHFDETKTQASVDINELVKFEYVNATN